MPYGMSGNPYSSTYYICEQCGGKDNDFTAYFYTETHVHYQKRVGENGHTDWIIEAFKERVEFT